MINRQSSNCVEDKDSGKGYALRDFLHYIPGGIKGVIGLAILRSPLLPLINIEMSVFGPSYTDAFHEDGMEAVREAKLKREERKEHLDETLTIL